MLVTKNMIPNALIRKAPMHFCLKKFDQVFLWMSKETLSMLLRVGIYLEISLEIIKNMQFIQAL